MAGVLKIRPIATSTAHGESASEVAGEDDAGDDGIDVGDGMVGGSPVASSAVAPTSSGPADEDEDDDEADEETTCSICLINRQGPCRKYWLKFEKCMKEHGKEMENEQRSQGSGGGDDTAVGGETNESNAKEGGDTEQIDNEIDGVDVTTLATLEADWDAFMEKSTRPGEDDDDDDDEEDDEDVDEEEDEEDDAEEDDVAVDAGDEHSTSTVTGTKKEDTTSLAERCDKFMIPWIGCIQEHRNTYTLISNSFYGHDYIDPLESSIPNERRLFFPKTETKDPVVEEIDDVVRSGYIVKFHGVEIDLGNWMEYVDADDDDGNNKTVASSVSSSLPVAGSVVEPHLINTYASFHLTDPDNRRHIEVAYVKDQNGMLLGFDSFSKQRREEEEEEKGNNDNAKDEVDNAADTTPSFPMNGECTFHIIPGETTSIVVYAIYRGKKKDNDGGFREDVLYYTPAIPLPPGGAR